MKLVLGSGSTTCGLSWEGCRRSRTSSFPAGRSNADSSRVFPAIPDVLNVTRNGSSSAVLAVEVDLGGKALRSVFVPKPAVLQGVLREMAKGEPAAILVLTSTERRREAIDLQTSELDSSIPVAVETLPDACGREGLQALEKMFNPGVESSTLTEEKYPLFH